MIQTTDRSHAEAIAGLPTDPADIAGWENLLDEPDAGDSADVYERIAAFLAPLSVASSPGAGLAPWLERLLRTIPKGEHQARLSARSALRAARGAVAELGKTMPSTIPIERYLAAWPRESDGLVLCHAHLCAADAYLRGTRSEERTRRASAQIVLARAIGRGSANMLLADALDLYLDDGALTVLLRIDCEDYAMIQGRISAARASALAAFHNHRT